MAATSSERTDHHHPAVLRMSEPDMRYAYTSVASAASRADGSPMPQTVAVVGRGRVGTALAAALRAAGTTVDGPLGRLETTSADTVLLCVPDSEITAAATTHARVGAPARFVGHVSGATTLSALEPARRAGAAVFGLHPLQTFSVGAAPSLSGVGAAIAGSTSPALARARALAECLGMVAFELDDERRASYHAAASIGSNFLVTLEATAEAVAARAGFASDEARALLVPLVRQTVENWVARGPEAALTGPVARGDATTVAAQRSAVIDADPAFGPLFDALVERTEALAARRTGIAHEVVA
ncbi:MAG: Ketopantoate reductase PanG [uncultured Solirubrobacterales bacterium]|uniref:Ketopantoate reductase PanG n=1 Tax=uncultured Solirubrobacterales bacterium TaxID=768556 RepID=A0A6J4SJQ6_9ACTN|nr:MAG: Ketopantoate reductase PanG [uncultured Solirubrobacterales bacterium]